MVYELFYVAESRIIYFTDGGISYNRYKASILRLFQG